MLLTVEDWSMLLGACTQKERKKKHSRRRRRPCRYMEKLTLSPYGWLTICADLTPNRDSSLLRAHASCSFFVCSCWIFLDVATEFAIFKEQDEMTSPFPPKGSCPSTKEEGTSRSFYCVAVRSFDSRQSTVKKKDPDFCEPYHKSKHITSRMKSSSFVDPYDFFSTTSFPLSCNKIWKRCNIQIKPFPDGLQPG